MKRAFELGEKEMNIEIQIKLLKRANFLLKNIKDPDSPMILVATELKIQADEIASLRAYPTEKN